MVDDAKREAAAWVRVRMQAARSRRRLYGGWGVMWTNAGHGTVQLKPIEVPAATAGEVTIEVLASVVGPGTERAYYLRLPNARPRIPHRPGYSVAGRIVAVGSGVDGLQRGDLVAATGVPHASVGTIAADQVHEVPAGLDLESAATINLGVICAQGIHRANIEPGEPVCVVGAGLIGLIAQRLVAAAGAGPIIVVALSRRHEHAARAGAAAEFLVAGDERVADLHAPVVIEATGDPGALATCVAASGRSGRIVLLGSSRGVTPDVPVEEILGQEARMIGAHVNTLRQEEVRTGEDRQRVVAASYLRGLEDGRLSVTDLLTRRLDPREAEVFYREMGSSGRVLGGCSTGDAFRIANG